MIATEYEEEFCLAKDFSPPFIARLMEAGFLVMSMDLSRFDDDDEESEEEPFYLLLPKLHLVRSVLFFENLHVKKSVRRLLNRYELKPDADFELVIDRCVEKHGDDWLTPPLVRAIKEIRRSSESGVVTIPQESARPFSFALYRDDKLVAGEFGVVCGKVYTSYSGFYEEDNAGTVQIILSARYLEAQGFTFLDLGMPLDYKNDLGAEDISPEAFVALFRGA
jgi:Leu/Phe-tRNA-protein transferase